MKGKEIKNIMIYAAAFILVFMTATTQAASKGKGNKVDICHFDKDAGMFHVINVSQNAVDRHFSNHGDAYPGSYYADVDGDGFGDAAGETDSCPNLGFVDNGTDVFPNDPTEWADSDGDGVGDNSDVCPDVEGLPENNGCPASATLGSDLIVANNIYWSHGNGVSVLFNDGSGNFSSQNYSTRLGVAAVRVADFNNDGNDDFVTASYDNPEVWIGLGDGAGGFATSFAGVLAGAAAKISVNDFNNDGNLDIAIAQNSGWTTIGLGDGLGQFSATPPIPTGGSTRSIASGDIDGDGNMDFANIAHAGAHSLVVNYGDGAGGRTSAFTIEYGIVSLGVAIGDVDGDGWQDIVTGGLGGRPAIAVYLNDGTPELAPKQLYGPEMQVYVRLLEDFDGDGALDIAASAIDSSGWQIHVYYNDGDGNFNTPPVIFTTQGGEIGDMAIGDINEDGIKDIVATNYTGNSIDIVTGDGSGGFDALYRVYDRTMLRTVGVAVGNFNGPKPR